MKIIINQKAALLSVLIFISASAFSQSTDYTIQDETWSADNHDVLVTTNIIVAGNPALPVAVSTDAQVDLKSTTEIHLKNGFSARQFSATGSFHAMIIPSFDNLLVDYSVRGPECFNDGDGNLTARTVGGGGIYEYSLDEGEFSSTSSWTNLSVGIHTLTVRDNMDNSTTIQVEIPPVDLTSQSSE
jgi:hypothetical protein